MHNDVQQHKGGDHQDRLARLPALAGPRGFRADHTRRQVPVLREHLREHGERHGDGCRCGGERGEAHHLEAAPRPASWDLLVVGRRSASASHEVVCRQGGRSPACGPVNDCGRCLLVLMAGNGITVVFFRCHFFCSCCRQGLQDVGCRIQGNIVYRFRNMHCLYNI